jgi:small subunit ribosomal protein S5
VVKVFRCSTVVKGGRRFSFAALVVVGDGNGRVGHGYGKANEVPPAVEKGLKGARASLNRVQIVNGTIPHLVTGAFGSTRVLLRPAAPGTGVIAGAAVRAVVEAAGIKNVLTKVFGSRNPKNVVKATVNALRALRTRAEVERLRGVTLE